MPLKSEPEVSQSMPPMWSTAPLPATTPTLTVPVMQTTLR